MKNPIPKYLLVLLLIKVVPAQLNAQLRKVDSLRQLLKHSKSDTGKIDLNLSLAMELDYAGKRSKAKQLLIETKFKSEKLNYLSGITNSLLFLAKIEGNEGNFPQSLKYDLAALKILENSTDTLGLYSCYNGLGVLYFRQVDYERAYTMFLKAYTLINKYNKPDKTANILNNIGAVLRVKGDTSKAIQYFKAALKIANSIQHDAEMATSYNGIAETSLAMNKFSNALRYCLASLKIREQIGEKQRISSASSIVARTYLKLNDVENATTYFQKELTISAEINNKLGLAEAHKYLSLINESKGNYLQALLNYKKYISYRDSISNDENTKAQARTEMQYEFDKKQTADSIKTAEHAKQEQLKHGQEIKQQRMYTYGGIIGFGLMLIVAFVSFRAFRNKKKANLIIEHQKELVEEKQKEILDSIHYAKRIQDALLPNEKYIIRNINRNNSK